MSVGYIDKVVCTATPAENPSQFWVDLDPCHATEPSTLPKLAMLVDLALFMCLLLS